MPAPANTLPPDDNDAYPYSFDDARQQAEPVLVRRRRRRDDDGESIGDEILDSVTDGIDLPIPGLGCLWGLVMLPFRLIGKLIDLFD